MTGVNVSLIAEQWSEGQIFWSPWAVPGGFDVEMFEPCSSRVRLQRQSRQIEVETGRCGSSRCRDEQKKWGQCHPVSLTMQAREGISLTYITPSAASPRLTSPSPPVPLHHPRCSPSRITKLMVAYLFSQHFECSFSSLIFSMKISGECWRGGARRRRWRRGHQEDEGQKCKTRCRDVESMCEICPERRKGVSCGGGWKSIYSSSMLG